MCYAAYRMYRNLRLTGVLLAAVFFQACAVAPVPDSKIPGQEARMMVVERVSAVVVTDQSNLQNWVSRGFSSSQTPSDADGGSATPISPDGYFLTADHVLAECFRALWQSGPIDSQEGAGGLAVGSVGFGVAAHS